MRHSIPRSLTAARIMLWGMAVLILMGALNSYLYLGGAFGAGTATLQVVPALICGAYAQFLPRTGRIALGIAVTLLVLTTFYQMNRIVQGDAFGILGLCYTMTLLVLLLLPSSRAFLRR